MVMVLARYVWVFKLLLVTAAALIAADIAGEYAAMWLSAPVVRPPGGTAGAAPPPVERLEMTDYAIIAQRNLFNANPPSGEAAPPAEVKVAAAEVQPTTLRLRLVGIVAGDAPDHAYAVIEDQQRGGEQDLYQLGDAVSGAAVVGIRFECVWLDNANQREKLCFEDDMADRNGGSPPPRQAPRAARRPSKEPADGDVVRVDEQTWRLKRDLVTEQFADLGTLSRQVRVTPHTIRGEPAGFRLTRLRPGLLQRIGLVNGDVLQRVNRLDVNSPEEALKAYQAIQSESTVRLEILRRNAPMTLTYEIR